MTIAAAHAFICSLAIAAICAGFYLDCLQRAIFFITAVISAAGNPATDMSVRMLCVHVSSSCLN